MKFTNNISVAQWNIKGLHDPIFGGKLQLSDFTNSLFIHDINILTDTWGCSHEINLPNYGMKSVKPNKIKGKKSGRSLGGIIVLYKNHLKSKIEFVKFHKNYIWIKLKNLRTSNVLMGNTNTLYICA